MFCAILKATNNSFRKGMTFCRSIYVKKVMKLLALIFEQPSYSAYGMFNRYHHAYQINQENVQKSLFKALFIFKKKNVQ